MRPNHREALVVDVSKHLNRVIDFDAKAGTVSVEPGIALDQLNSFLNPHGYMFTVDVSTSSRATIGGMAGNNSCGARSIRCKARCVTMSARSMH